VEEFEGVELHTSFEMLGVLGLVFGSWLTLREYRRLLRRTLSVERELDAASGAFQAMLERHFDEWGLTGAERDVALMSVKGLSNAEIAEMRQAKVGTVKAQCTAVYRKAGVSSRAELVSAVIEDLIAGVGLPEGARRAE
jgi:DNA-binding CsgD family transcriptional regulator